MRNLCLILPSSIIYLQGWQPYEMISRDMAAYNSRKEIINKGINSYIYSSPHDTHVHIGCQVRFVAI